MCVWGEIPQTEIKGGRMDNMKDLPMYFSLFILTRSGAKYKIVQLKRELRVMSNLCCLFYMINTVEFLVSCLAGKKTQM